MIPVILTSISTARKPKKPGFWLILSAMRKYCRKKPGFWRLASPRNRVFGWFCQLWGSIVAKNPVSDYPQAQVRLI